MQTATLEKPAAAKQCPICPPILPGQSWLDRCTCGDVRFRHQAITHDGTLLGRGVTCHGQNLAGKCPRPECGCARFTLKAAEGPVNAL